MSDNICPVCETPLTEEDRHADHRAPEVGYEYYECPDCGHQYRPERIEADDAADGDAPDSDHSDADSASDETDTGTNKTLAPALQTVADIIDEKTENGEGADKDEVITEVIKREQVTPEEAEDLLNDLLMQGECYEPAEDKLKTI